MTSIRKIERDHVSADIATIEAMIRALSDEDLVMRLSLEDRRDELVQKLRGLEAPAVASASAALFFGGRPVIGGRGIESEFGGKAVATFQDLVSKQFVQERGNLGQRGVVPNKAATRLHITNIVRGSFGFFLEELEGQPAFLDSSLKTAVDNVSKLMVAFGEDNEERFESVVEAVDSRVLVTAREFFSLMHQDGATFRIVVDNSDHSFDAISIERASSRAKNTNIEDAEERIRGALSGVLPEGHLFEYRTETDRGVIRGKIDKGISVQESAALYREWVDKQSTANFRVRRIIRNGDLVREGFTLLSLTN